MTKDTDCGNPRKSDIEDKMDELIEYYENMTASSASEARRRLRARNIFCYEAQKTVSAFDKMSHEGKARERQDKREKFLVQRGYDNNPKRRKLDIGIPSPDIQTTKDKYPCLLDNICN
ncbi:hypothetical protein IW146_007395 [Coemansia sp. RSA 922]|nr:hypothetical protein GGI14_001102 [Coemansia sp. S680]KAJ2043314.1 hypothetical protein H4S04_006822 [Coemansia sp. S16]KAJ2058421.1 hypothetical protein GGI08_003430 [Coemansia sp. S2]KAJ2070087.1 hypothetical protein GGH13_004276 [Coemansia sp. S155-1]KAJ2072293.1 hypothetical protein GGI09_009136 [Coemansia sp. S100]KAJ2107279.1 hypothetical protein IW146_007395 [Coemansia sp. RSA 922]KAJ2347396.1 hypothetical protein GGH92_003215 [Coemansia sp. RSA 2673]